MEKRKYVECSDHVAKWVAWRDSWTTQTIVDYFRQYHLARSTHEAYSKHI